MRRLLFALAWLVALHGPATAQSDLAGRPVVTVTLLGTGAPPPLPDRFGPATLVQAGGQALLFDAGRGATIRLRQLNLPGSAVTATFLTHLHSDHVVGLPDLWLTGWLRGPHGGRSTAYRLIGPDGTVELAAGLEAAFAADVRYRIAGGLPPEGGRIAAEAFDSDGIVYDVDGLRVTAFRVDHGPWVDAAYGYRIDYRGRSVVISGDARPSDSVIRHGRGVDLLIHEVVYARPGSEQSAAAVLDTHTQPREAGRIFAATRPGMAAYFHFALPALDGAPPPPASDVLAPTREVYDGPLTLGEDLMAFHIMADGTVEVARAKA